MLNGLFGDTTQIITLFEVSTYEQKNELYFVMELLDGDLQKVISRSKQPLTDRHLKCFMKQLLEGIKAMHSVGVFHRDLKPANILISKNCELRISDFGWSRYMHRSTRHGSNKANPMTEYIITRWYRSPELLVAPKNLYDEKIDLWSIGCIFAEMILREPLFPGTSFTDQIMKILKVFGYKDTRDLGVPINKDNTAFLDKHCKGPSTDLREIFKTSGDSQLSLLRALLKVNPYLRANADEALLHEYLNDAEEFYDYSVNYLSPIPVEQFDFEVRRCSGAELKDMIRGEVSVSRLLSPPTKFLDLIVSPSDGSASEGGNSNSKSKSNDTFESSQKKGDNSARNQQQQQQQRPKKKENPFRSKSGGGEDPNTAETVHRQSRIARSDSDVSAVSDLSEIESISTKNKSAEVVDLEECPFDKPLEYSDSETDELPPTRIPATARTAQWSEKTTGAQSEKSISEQLLEDNDDDLPAKPVTGMESQPQGDQTQQAPVSKPHQVVVKQKQEKGTGDSHVGYGVVPAASPSAVPDEDHHHHHHHQGVQSITCGCSIF